MPKIIIKEAVSSDTTEAYQDYVVLIPGVSPVSKTKLYTTKEELDTDIATYDADVSHKNNPYNTTFANDMWYKYLMQLLNLNYVVLIGDLGESNNKASFEKLTNYDNFWKQFEDRGLYDIRFIVGCYDEDLADVQDVDDKKAVEVVAENMIKCAATRGDAVALIDTPKDTTSASDIATWCKGLTVDKVKRDDDIANDEDAMPYAGAFAPRFTAKELDNTYYPISLGYLSSIALNLSTRPIYQAAAGRIGGKLPYTNVVTNVDYGDQAIDVLQTRTIGDKCCNVISTIRPFGNIVWGNRTLHAIESEDLSSKDFLNIRQLACSIKKVGYRTARKYTFEPNDDVLWINFTSDIIPTLNKMKSNRGIRSYRIEKLIDKKLGTLKAKIYVTPIDAVEDFDITIDLRNSIDNI